MTAAKKTSPAPTVVHFGRYLKDLREAQGLSQGDVADHFKWKTGNFVAQWESEHSPLPLKYIPQLARLYKVPHLEMRKAAAKSEIATHTAIVRKKYGLEEKSK